MASKIDNETRQDIPDEAELCVYCGSEPGVTRDHVIPQCLFLKPLPAYMPTVPACDPCNKKKGRNDDYLRDMMATHILADGHPVAEALRTTKIKRAVYRNRSAYMREAQAKGRLRPMYSPAGLYLGQHIAIPLDGGRLRRMLTTIVRGLCFERLGVRLPNNCPFVVEYLQPKATNELRSIFANMGAVGPLVLGDGVFACMFMTTKEDPTLACWLMSFYGGVSLFVSTGHVPPAYRAAS